MSAGPVWHCAACETTHDDGTEQAHHGVARATIGATTVEAWVYACDAHRRDVFLARLAAQGAALSRHLASAEALG